MRVAFIEQVDRTSIGYMHSPYKGFFMLRTANTVKGM